MQREAAEASYCRFTAEEAAFIDEAMPKELAECFREDVVARFSEAIVVLIKPMNKMRWFVAWIAGSPSGKDASWDIIILNSQT